MKKPRQATKGGQDSGLSAPPEAREGKRLPRFAFEPNTGMQMAVEIGLIACGRLMGEQQPLVGEAVERFDSGGLVAVRWQDVVVAFDQRPARAGVRRDKLAHQLPLGIDAGVEQITQDQHPRGMPSAHQIAEPGQVRICPARQDG